MTFVSLSFDFWNKSFSVMVHLLLFWKLCSFLDIVLKHQWSKVYEYCYDVKESLDGERFMNIVMI